jgi:hypothetical protein
MLFSDKRSIMQERAKQAVELYMEATGHNQSVTAKAIGVSVKSLNLGLNHPGKWPKSITDVDKLIKFFPKLTRADIIGPEPGR